MNMRRLSYSINGEVVSDRRKVVRTLDDKRSQIQNRHKKRDEARAVL